MGLIYAYAPHSLLLLEAAQHFRSCSRKTKRADEQSRNIVGASSEEVLAVCEVSLMFTREREVRILDSAASGVRFGWEASGLGRGSFA